jgi:hypothetical protein
VFAVDNPESFLFFVAWRLISMQQQQFDLLSQFQQQPMC